MGFKKVQKLFHIPKIFLRRYTNMKDKTPKEAALAKL